MVKEREIDQCIGNNCYAQQVEIVFIKCFKYLYLTGTDYKEEILSFIRDQKRRSHVMTEARIQPFCKKHTNNIGCFEGSRINPRNITEKNIALCIH